MNGKKHHSSKGMGGDGAHRRSTGEGRKSGTFSHERMPVWLEESVQGGDA